MSLILRDVNLSVIWCSGNETGYSIGFKTGIKGRNIHLTSYSRNGVLNCHLTDTGKDPPKVWEKYMREDDFERLGERFSKECLKKYRWYHSYYPLSFDYEKLIETKQKNEKTELWEYDFEKWLDGFLSKGALIKTRLRKAYKNGPNIGFFNSKGKSYIAIPLEKNLMLAIDTDLEKTPFWEIPIVQGYSRLIDYLTQERIFEQMKTLTPEDKEDFKNALIGTLLDKGVEPEDIEFEDDD